MQRAKTAISSALLCLALLSACATPTAFDLADEAQLRADIAWLADPARLGREPGGPAEPAIREYAIDRMSEIGLEPAFRPTGPANGWLQPMVMTYRTPVASSATFHHRGKTLSLPDDQFVLVGESEAGSFDNLPILFVDDAPTSLLDSARVEGHVVLIARPDNAKEQNERIAALYDAGAIGAVTIVEDRSDFRRITQDMLEPGFFVRGGKPVRDAAREEGFFTAMITEQGIVQLADFAREDWDRLKRDADSDDYGGSTLKLTVDVDWQAAIEERETANVAGRLRGRKPGTGAVLFMGHWDHLGRCGEGSDEAICPGAVDNASGIASIWQIADHLAQHRHDRDIYFLLTTGEEEGFVGANRFLTAPPIPLTDFTAILNLDMLAIGSGTTDVAVIGWQGGNAVDTAIDDVLRSLGLNRVETGGYKAYLKRQDGWVFLEQGLPSRMVNSSFANDRLLGSFVNSAYHQPTDRYSPDMALGSAAQDIAIHVALGERFADIERFPGR